MKKGFIFVTLMALGCAAVFGQDGKGPILEFTETEHDFGNIDKGEKVTHTFNFKNSGGEPLEIVNVATSCGCTSAAPEKKIYAPGENGEISVTFDSGRFSGKITKKVTITTNNSLEPKTIVTIKGNIVVDVVSKPVSVYFANARVGETVSQEIHVSTSKMEKLEITNLKTAHDFLTAELKQEDDQNAKIILTVDGNKVDKNKSRLISNLTYETNSETQKKMRAAVTVTIVQPIRLSPTSVYFFASKAGQKRETRVKLVSTEGKSFSISDLKADLDYVDVTIAQDEDKTKSLVITLNDKAPQGKFNGNITLKTNNEAQPQIQIPIRGSVIQ